VKLGLKDMANREAQARYIDECQRMLDEINIRYVRAKLGHLSRDDADAALARIERRLAAAAEQTAVGEPQELVLPDAPTVSPHIEMVGSDGEQVSDVEEYIAHCLAHLPEAYRASIDVKHWIEMQRKVAKGEIELKKAISSMPRLARVGGACPCSKAVRWVMDVPAGASAGGERLDP